MGALCVSLVFSHNCSTLLTRCFTQSSAGRKLAVLIYEIKMVRDSRA